jgi:CHAP domain
MPSQHKRKTTPPWRHAARWLRRLAACAALGFAVIVAVGYGSDGARGLDAPLAPGTASPIVYGYSYTAACPAAGIADLVDRWALSECNCTSYVAWALQANRQRIDWFIAGAMDARNWPHVAQLSRLRVGTLPRVGAVAVWARVSRPFGHVAYVTRVDPDGTFDVAEYNFPGASLYAFDQRFGVRRRGAVFIYVPRV